MIQIVIVDDHQIVVTGLRKVLERDRRLSVVGSANTIAAAMDVCRAKQPDLLILDLRLPDSRGTLEIAEFRRIFPRMLILVLTGYGSEAREEAFDMGASAFLTKELAADVMVQTILGLFSVDADGEAGILTDRELQIATLAAEGMNNPEIAEELMISRNTVKTHMARVLEKLGVKDRYQLADRLRQIR